MTTDTSKLLMLMWRAPLCSVDLTLCATHCFNSVFVHGGIFICTAEKNTVSVQLLLISLTRLRLLYIVYIYTHIPIHKYMIYLVMDDPLLKQFE